MELSLNQATELNSLVKKSSDDKQLAVEVNTLDNFIAENPSLTVSCIKTDAEGADLEILLGGKNLLIRDQPLVLSEAYPNSKLLKYIQSIGFTCFAFVKPKDAKMSHLPPKFMKIEIQPQNYRLKMIFLVPPRLLSEFEKLTDT